MSRRAGGSRRPEPDADGRQDDALRLDEAFIRRLERLSLRVRRVGAALGGRPGARRVPAADFIDHRPYSPGDDIRHIDWAAYARHDQLSVRLGRVAQAAEVRILLDASPSMARGARKWRAARELAAALGWLSLAAGDRVGLQAFPASRASAWGPASGAGAGGSLLGFVGALAPSPAEATRLEPAVSAAAAAAPGGGLLVLISDLWIDDDLPRALARAPGPRWDTLVLHVLGRDELEPPDDGPLLLEDAESGESLRLVVDAEMREAYRRALHARLDRLHAICAGAGASWHLLPADWPLERGVIPYLQRRAVLGG